MQDGKGSNCLAGVYPSNGDMLLLSTFNQFHVPRNHRVPAQPDFPDLEVFDDTEQPVHVVVMSVCQYNGITATYSTREQIRRNDVFTDREGALVSEIQETP